MEPIYIKILVAGLVGFVSKIIWDWLNSGKIEKGDYVMTSHCDEIRDKCCLPTLKKEIGILETKSDSHEKILDENKQDFALLRKDIGYLALKVESLIGKVDMVLGVSPVKKRG